MKPTSTQELKQSNQPEISPTRIFKRLEGNVELALHTRMAQSLLQGRRQHGQMSLWHFAARIRILLDHQTDKDLYASECLLKIEQKIRQIHEQMQTIEIYYQKRLEKMRGLKIEVFRNPEPMEFSLKFLTPLSFAAASLLPDFDYLACQAYTLKHVGQQLEPEYLPKRVYREIRSLFSLPYENTILADK